MRNTVFLITLVIIMFVVACALIVSAIIKSNQDEPYEADDTTPTDNTDVAGETDIRPIVDDNKVNPNEKNGEAVIDVIEAGKEYEKNPEPAVDGEVVIIPGVKGANE